LIKVTVFFNEYINKEKLNIEEVKYITGRVFTDRNIDKAGISIIFVDDEYITNLNERYFRKNYPTDVISFNLENPGEAIEGEVYVNVDDARRHAEEYGITAEEELVRLFVHGALHVLGFEDSEARQKDLMRESEDVYVKLFKERNSVSR